MHKTFNGEKLYLLDIRTLSHYDSPYGNTIYYSTFESPKAKKFDLKMFTNPIAITGLYKKQYLIYSLNDQMQIFELGSLKENKIEPKTSPSTFIARFNNFYASTSKLELIELYKKHCREAKKKLESDIKRTPSIALTEQTISYYRGIMGKIEKTYRDFLKQIKQL